MGLLRLLGVGLVALQQLFSSLATWTELDWNVLMKHPLALALAIALAIALHRTRAKEVLLGLNRVGILDNFRLGCQDVVTVSACALQSAWRVENPAYPTIPSSN